MITPHTTRRQWLEAACAAALSASPLTTRAQTSWPSKPLRLVVPFAPGGSSEIVARAVAGEIGKVICGELEGRQSDEQITVFDSTGIALQDSATVPLEYERAVAAGVGVEKKMIST